MGYKTIELNFTGNEKEPRYFLTEYNDKREKVFTTQTRSVCLNEHYILMVDHFAEMRGAASEPFDVAHDIVEADKKLHNYLKKLGERITKDESIDMLIDNTKHAPEKLPKGGK